MKKIIIVLLLISGYTFAQKFTVEKASGDIKVLKGTSEEWVNVKAGQTLSEDDLLMTGDKSFVQLNKDGNRFILQSSSALGLNHIKKVSLNDLLLALTMEEIRRVPKKGGSSNTENTAVYGSEISSSPAIEVTETDMGIRRLNGAKQLAESGYKESAIIVAKETYRKYPGTRRGVEDRLYFAEILINLNLYEEAHTELTLLKGLENISAENASKISRRLDDVKSKIVN